MVSMSLKNIVSLLIDKLYADGTESSTGSYDHMFVNHSCKFIMVNHTTYEESRSYGCFESGIIFKWFQRENVIVLTITKENLHYCKVKYVKCFLRPQCQVNYNGLIY